MTTTRRGVDDREARKRRSAAGAGARTRAPGARCRARACCSTTLRSVRRCRHAGPMPCPIDICCTSLSVSASARPVTRRSASASSRKRRTCASRSAPLLLEVAVRRALQQRLGRGHRPVDRGGQRGDQVRHRRVELVGRDRRPWPGRCRTASSAPTHRAVAQISSARGVADELDQRLCSGQVRDQAERRLRMENFASSATTRRSQASASWKPAPTA